ncbi:MAG: YbaN family protein [Rikenellaceae bacterium]
MKLIFILLGCISLVLGVIGVVVPLLPTTPFLLLSAALFVKSSPKLYAWLIDNPILGSYIRNYREHKAIPRHAKYTSITLLWISILYCLFFVVQSMLWVQILLFVVAVGVTCHLLSLGTISRNSDDE